MGQLCMFGLQSLEILLVIPREYTVGGEQQIHLLQSSLVGFRIERPGCEDGEDVDGSE